MTQPPQHLALARAIAASEMLRLQHDHHTAPPKRVCGWCGLLLANGTEPETTGMCEVCAAHADVAMVFTDPVTQRRFGLVPVASSNLAAAGWYAEADSGVALVRFTSGTAYRYACVPRGWWLGFLAAESKGQYFGATLRAEPARFPCTKVADDDRS
jgi:hypothetical protein